MTETLLTVDKLCKRFGAVSASNELSFSVHRGELHALIGPNGAGKTTAVNLVSGDILPDRGRIHFAGRDISRLPGHRRARLGIARSFQITHIFESMSVAENMGLALCAHLGHNFRFFRPWRRTRHVREHLFAALERVDLGHRAELPARHLSHGEKRQLEVGMALVGHPHLLILDEPMAGLGPGGTRELSRLIATLKGKMTILLVEHDMEVVFSLADRVTVLVYGEAVAQGSPDEIRADPRVRAAYLGEEE